MQISGTHFKFNFLFIIHNPFSIAKLSVLFANPTAPSLDNRHLLWLRRLFLFLVYLAQHLGILRLLLFSLDGCAILGNNDQLLSLLRLWQSALLPTQTLHTLDPHVVLLQLPVCAVPSNHRCVLDLSWGNDLSTLLLLVKFWLLLIRWGCYILLLRIISIYWILLISCFNGFAFFNYLVLSLDHMLLLLILGVFIWVCLVSHFLIILLLLFVHKFLNQIIS